MLQQEKNKTKQKTLTLVGLRHSSSQITWIQEIKNRWLLESSHETRIAEMNLPKALLYFNALCVHAT